MNRNILFLLSVIMCNLSLSILCMENGGGIGTFPKYSSSPEKKETFKNPLYNASVVKWSPFEDTSISSLPQNEMADQPSPKISPTANSISKNNAPHSNQLFFLTHPRAIVQKPNIQNLANWSQKKSKMKILKLPSNWHSETHKYIIENVDPVNVKELAKNSNKTSSTLDPFKNSAFYFEKVGDDAEANKLYIFFYALTEPYQLGKYDKARNIFTRINAKSPWNAFNQPVEGFKETPDAFALEKTFTYKGNDRIIRGVFKKGNALYFGNIHIGYKDGKPKFVPNKVSSLQAAGNTDNMSLTVNEDGKITLFEQKDDTLIERDVTEFLDKHHPIAYESPLQSYLEDRKKALQKLVGTFGSFAALLGGLCFWKKEALTRSFDQAKTFAQPYFSTSAQSFGSFASTQWTNLANRGSSLFGWLGSMFSRH